LCFQVNITKKRNVTEKLDVSVPSKQFSDLFVFTFYVHYKKNARLLNLLVGEGGVKQGLKIVVIPKESRCNDVKLQAYLKKLDRFENCLVGLKRTTDQTPHQRKGSGKNLFNAYVCSMNGKILIGWGINISYFLVQDFK